MVPFGDRSELETRSRDAALSSAIPSRVSRTDRGAGPDGPVEVPSSPRGAQGREDPGQIATGYRVHPNSVGTWKRWFLERGPQLFEQAKETSAQQRRVAELEQLLSKKEVELALSKNFLARPGSRSWGETRNDNRSSGTTEQNGGQAVQVLERTSHRPILRKGVVAQTRGHPSRKGEQR